MTGHDHTHSHHAHDHDDRWKHDGVRVIPGNQLDTNVPSTAGMERAAAINFARVGAQKLWAGTVSIKPDAKTGALTTAISKASSMW
ncbi:putative RmlC-like cupin family protein [Bradyrhizobium diazoefficiens]